MKFKFIHLILVLILVTNLKAQNIAEKDRVKSIKSSYLHFTKLFKKKNYVYHKVDFNKKDYLFETINENKIEKYLNFINNSLTLEVIDQSQVIDHPDYADLKITINLPDFFKNLSDKKFMELFHRQIDVTLESNDLIDQFNEPLNLSYVDKKFNSKKIEYSILIVKDSLYKNQPIKISGEIKYKLKLLTNYDEIKIKTEQVGSTFKLGKSEYKLIDYFNNSLIIKKISGPNESIKTISLTSDGKLARPYSFSEFNDLKKNDSSYANKVNFRSFVSNVTPYFFYELLKNEPDITLERFDQLLTPDKLEELKKIENSERIIIVPTVSNLNSEHILYTPQYKTEIIEINK
ncbi:hypothetical protein N1F78_01555 [Seonamhaeicola sp. MEBiC1930]|uniref:hypothetical protein n=1 Tax=Seonamhaeicola sp. MEBiC01930 TaxID=2976768 RepID=UPI003245D75D